MDAAGDTSPVSCHWSGGSRLPETVDVAGGLVGRCLMSRNMLTSSCLISRAGIFVLIASCCCLTNVATAYDTATVINCDKDFISSAAQNGTFSSPFYPRPHPGDITCRYRFQGQGRERVQVIFNVIDLNPIRMINDSTKQIYGDRCDDVDSLTVSIFIDGQPRDIGVYCGKQRSSKLMSNDNRLEVTFISRSIKPDAMGFEATFGFVTDFGVRGSGTIATDMVCGFIFKSDVAPNGTFTSPNFPGMYPRNTECHYLFYGAPNELIYITFPYFDVEGVPPACSEETQSDYVEFSNFNVNLMDRKMYRLCGTKSSHNRNDVTSDGNFFRVTFKSNDAFDASGFEAFYQFRKSDIDIYNPKRPHDGQTSAAEADNSATPHFVAPRSFFVVMATLASCLFGLPFS